jgi:hypothetical protein
MAVGRDEVQLRTATWNDDEENDPDICLEGNSKSKKGPIRDSLCPE